MPPPRPALLVLNQYYAPGQESTAQLLTELCEALAEEYDVTVVTGTVYHAPKPERTTRNGVTIIRVGSTAFDRSRLALRGFNYLSFVTLALAAGLRRPRPRLVLCLSDPPFVSAIGVAVARRHRAPLLVVTQDVFPEIAVALDDSTTPSSSGSSAGSCGSGSRTRPGSSRSGSKCGAGWWRRESTTTRSQ